MVCQVHPNIILPFNFHRQLHSFSNNQIKEEIHFNTVSERVVVALPRFGVLANYLPHLAHSIFFLSSLPPLPSLSPSLFLFLFILIFLSFSFFLLPASYLPSLIPLPFLTTPSVLVSLVQLSLVLPIVVHSLFLPLANHRPVLQFPLFLHPNLPLLRVLSTLVRDSLHRFNLPMTRRRCI